MSRRSRSVLFQTSADEILQRITARKNDINRRFLQRMVRVAQDNLQRCL